MNRRPLGTNSRIRINFLYYQFTSAVPLYKNEAAELEIFDSPAFNKLWITLGTSVEKPIFSWIFTALSDKTPIPLSALKVLAARVVVHLVDQYGNRLRIGMLTDAVPEIKDMTALADVAEGVHHLSGFATNGFFTGKEHQRIHIALKADGVARAAARCRQVHGPIHADAVGADL